MTIKEIFAAWMELYDWHEHLALTRLESAVQEVIDAKDARIADLENENAGLDKENDDLSRWCTAKNKMIDKYKQRIAALEAENAQLRADKAELVAALEAENAQLRRKIILVADSAQGEIVKPYDFTEGLKGDGLEGDA